jgi:hypothetical protein
LTLFEGPSSSLRSAALLEREIKEIAVTTAKDEIHFVLLAIEVSFY